MRKIHLSLCIPADRTKGLNYQADFTMAAPVSFGNGISGISRIDSALVHSDYPKSKSNFRTSGKNVVDYTWKTLEMDQNYERREFKFATEVSGQNISSSPEEHYRFTQDAMDSFSGFLKQLPDNSSKAKRIKEALSVIEKAKADSEYLMMCRNVLIAS
ncbi:hypothetical protein J7438_04290 [Thalassotalea sp. G20_0]|uniref:hypothetical protein n=1 Tax=Thalassotalea sp. G20_0 TaxID=2821093 RepID=UPI001ADBE50B|nr:hypothetical protein [Thalassotalea sp. G20_0]MBO9493308.1 hypothetical protein [Thalassotalea sp. G20_0]